MATNSNNSRSNSIINTVTLDLATYNKLLLAQHAMESLTTLVPKEGYKGARTLELTINPNVLRDQASMQLDAFISEYGADAFGHDYDTAPSGYDWAYNMSITLANYKAPEPDEESSDEGSDD